MTRYETEIAHFNTLRVAVATTGLRGGDSGHGGRTVFELEDLSSTDIEVSLIEPSVRGRGGVVIRLGGDSELETFIKALEWAAATLRQQR